MLKGFIFIKKTLPFGSVFEYNKLKLFSRLIIVLWSVCSFRFWQQGFS